MRDARYDVIIIGAGHNGLVCGAYLARAGQKVLVLERRPLIGGACVTEEVWPGYKVSTASYVMALLQPKVILDLELARYGYEILKPPPMFQPFPDGRSLTFFDEEDRTCAEIAKFSKKDAAAYPEYRRYMRRLAPIMREIIWDTPFNVSSNPRDLLSAARFLWGKRGYVGDFYQLYDLLTLSAHDVLSHWFESDEIRAALGFYATGGGGSASLRSPGTGYVLLRPLVRDHETAAGGWGFVRGGMGAISGAIAASGKAHGMEVRTDAEVASILVENGRAAGVVLASGETLRAGRVAANASARTTFTRLLDARHVPAEVTASAQNLRARGSVYKVHLALDALPRFSAFDPAAAGFPYPAQVRIGPSVDYLEQSFDPAKYGDYARHPFMVAMTPTVLDETLAPPGRHFMSIMAGHAPYDLKGGWTDAAREAIGDAVVDTLETYAPGFKALVRERHIYSPADLERVFDLPGGHVHHAEISADQMFMRRPAPGYADYRTPVPGLYLCGASVHPGGGVTGVPGHNAAREILRDAKRR
ncbi:phytoene desaturase family protein [Aquabacter sp. P-9]|uniref:phytoene desaturase family protein n=1 Tax=Aquabacter sediminis TaxID=3029197 RepID=UPI00237EA06C|nr:NAD(P)/FAD-dependent oxidoreductase [Aquabacter sp. P-9]MDE1569118.1 NAD(P)/FAD-dependent oxidoreductase [Aquabacter sp. P-9]